MKSKSTFKDWQAIRKNENGVSTSTPIRFVKSCCKCGRKVIIDPVKDDREGFECSNCINARQYEL